MSATYTNVWDALCDSADESRIMSVRSKLMMAITEKIDEFGWSQSRAASLLGVTQPRISDLYCGKIDRFTAESLQKMAEPLGIGLQVAQFASPTKTDVERHELPA